MLKPAVAASLVALLGFACHQAPGSRVPPTRVRITSGTPGGGFQPLGEALGGALRSSMPDTSVDVRESAGSVSNVEAIQRGDADVGFAFADVAYTAFAGGLSGSPHPFDRLRAIAVLQLNPLHLVVAPRSGIRDVADLRGRRVGVGRPGSGTALTATLVMSAFGVNVSTVQIEPITYNDAAARLARGTLDALFVAGSDPLESVSIALRAGATLLPLRGPVIEALRHQYPFLRRAIIPARTYDGQPEQVQTIGVDNLLVCSNRLGESLVYDLTRHLFDALPALAAAQRSLRLMDLEQAPATPIPLHEGAARYYREREIAQ
jgi:uncharacterized protein